MLSSVLTDVMQMLPSAVNSHTRSNKYQYMFEEKLYITIMMKLLYSTLLLLADEEGNKIEIIMIISLLKR